MSIEYFPFDSGPGANSLEASWQKMARLWLGDGVIRGAFNGFQAYADASGMNSKVKTGRAWIQGFYVGNTSSGDADTTLSIAASHATLERYDRVVLRLDLTGNTISLAVIQGTNAAVGTASPPALTQTTTTWEISLAKVLVSPTVVNIAAGKVTDERQYAAPRFGEPSDNSGFNVVQSGVNTSNVSSGARYDLVAAASTAGAATASQMEFVGNVLSFYSDSGLTPGNTYTRTKAFQIDASRNMQVVGNDNRFGAGALGGTGTFLKIGDEGSSTQAFLIADGSGSNVDVVLRTKGTSSLRLQKSDGTDWLLVDNAGDSAGSTTSLQIRLNAVTRRIEVGATDSGGSGYRMLRVAN
jgi:hypothetical protein